ncbi:MAG: hypothetical protein DRG78_21775 [Epsilonproteobacteria bacterium]|nr:MAG: hypothetical protein DRG78_21775 [Campylobacterota bacterium]
MVPFFLTVDTEGDNIWGRLKDITSINTEKLYRFQELCEKYNVKPIYLTNYEAAINTGYQKFIEKHKKNLEVGLHLHAWNSPPSYDLTDDDNQNHPYLHEYPNEMIEKKISYMVKYLKETFKCDIISHRGGRYSISEKMIEILSDNGIKIDCSVVPGFDWSSHAGVPNGNGGPNFKASKSNIHTIYDKMIEIPVSTYRINKYFDLLKQTNIIRRGFGKLFNYKNSTLRSKVDNYQEMQKVVKWNLANNATHLEYIIHSSELVSGQSSLINSQEEEDLFYNNLEQLFILLNESGVRSLTFKEYLNYI